MLGISRELCLNQDIVHDLLDEASIKRYIHHLMMYSTLNYISLYLNPCLAWEDKTNIQQNFEILKSDTIHYTHVESHIKEMEYKDFLQTPYWKAITAKLKEDCNHTCELCGHIFIQLQVHHKTHAHHGSELFHLEDLMVVCKDCHEKLHNTEEENYED